MTFGMTASASHYPAGPLQEAAGGADCRVPDTGLPVPAIGRTLLVIHSAAQPGAPGRQRWTPSGEKLPLGAPTTPALTSVRPVALPPTSCLYRATQSDCHPVFVMLGS